jgi:hypothetical protein
VTFEILELNAHPPLVLTPMTTAYGGTLRVGQQGPRMITSGSTGREFGFFVPEVPPLDETLEPPATWAEVYLMLATVMQPSYELGIDRVTAAYLPDPRGGTARWLHCGGLTHAPYPVLLGYRITVQRRSQAG